MFHIISYIFSISCVNEISSLLMRSCENRRGFLAEPATKFSEYVLLQIQPVWVYAQLCKPQIVKIDGNSEE